MLTKKMFCTTYTPSAGFLKPIEPSSSNNSSNAFGGAYGGYGGAYGGYGSSSSGFGSSNNEFGGGFGGGFGIGNSNSNGFGGGFGNANNNSSVFIPFNHIGSNNTTIPEIIPRDEVIRKLNEHKNLIVKQKVAKYISSFNDRTNVDRHEITKVNTEFIEDIVNELSKLLSPHNYKVSHNDKVIVFEYVYLGL